MKHPVYTRTYTSKTQRAPSAQTPGDKTWGCCLTLSLCEYTFPFTHTHTQHSAMQLAPCSCWHRWCERLHMKEKCTKWMWGHSVKIHSKPGPYRYNFIIYLVRNKIGFFIKLLSKKCFMLYCIKENKSKSFQVIPQQIDFMGSSYTTALLFSDKGIYYKLSAGKASLHVTHSITSCIELFSCYNVITGTESFASHNIEPNCC